MLLKSLSGLRFEVHSPSHLTFRLAPACGPIELEFSGAYWSLSSNKRTSYFHRKQDATKWLAQMVEKLENQYSTTFNYARMK